jgi:hypothetical protein
MPIWLLGLVGLIAGLLKLSAWIVGVVLVAATALDVLSVWRSPKHYLGKSRMGVGDILLTGVSNGLALVLPFGVAIGLRFAIEAVM